ncbi:hypothetical protein D9M68_477590 [compost metagenome]
MSFAASSSLPVTFNVLPAFMWTLPSVLPTKLAVCVTALSLVVSFWSYLPNDRPDPVAPSPDLVVRWKLWLELVFWALMIARSRPASRLTSWVAATVDPATVRSRPALPDTVSAEMTEPTAMSCLSLRSLVVCSFDMKLE